MITAIMKYGNETAFWLRMKSLGLVNEDAEGNRNPRQEDAAGRCLTPPATCSDGDKVLRILLEAKDADKLPPASNPAFAVVWRSDEVIEDNDGNQIVAPEPEFLFNNYSEDGDVTGQYSASAPKIMGY